MTRPVVSTPNFRTLDLNLLRVFDEIMAERSLTRAARNLALTQPAVSNALRRLRESLGDDLVRRHGQGLEPTPRALAMWPGVRDALAQLQAVVAPHQESPAQLQTTFVLAMADATAAELIPDLVETMEAVAPGVALRVLPLTTRDPRSWLEEGHADLAIGYFPAVLADLTAREQGGEAVAFEHQRLYEGEYVCVMREDHPLAREPLTLDAYCEARHLLVSFSGRPWGFVDEALAAIDRRRRVVLTVNQFFTAGQVVARTRLLTVLPRHFVQTLAASSRLCLRELPLNVPPVHVEALWHRRVRHAAGHAWLHQMILESGRRAFKNNSN
ncbi:MAG: LysR family transcriptional regulator [Burkholderiaceae bacterium]|jgi:DNA-binding transcriptional LysR family regulator|nr:LysR family transcriptional regulator [Burkholderiaceae bacterium]TXH29912.1 MAG: LysR family transcriptional regulator [Burkholderiaceae bacterium]